MSKILIWITLAIGFLTVAFGMMAMLTPMTYLKLYSVLGFGPVPVPWAILQAHEGLVEQAAQYCYQPMLLSARTSFGSRVVVPDGIQLPPKEAFTALVLINAGILFEHTKLALEAMSKFNVELLSQCFGYQGS